MDLSGKLCVVSGATEGIGRAIAFALGRSRAAVAICARTASAVEQTGEAIALSDAEDNVIPLQPPGDLEGRHHHLPVHCNRRIRLGEFPNPDGARIDMQHGIHHRGSLGRVYFYGNIFIVTAINVSETNRRSQGPIRLVMDHQPSRPLAEDIRSEDGCAIILLVFNGDRRIPWGVRYIHNRLRGYILLTTGCICQ